MVHVSRAYLNRILKRIHKLVACVVQQSSLLQKRWKNSIHFYPDCLMHCTSKVHRRKSDVDWVMWWWKVVKVKLETFHKSILNFIKSYNILQMSPLEWLRPVWVHCSNSQGFICFSLEFVGPEAMRWHCPCLALGAAMQAAPAPSP